MRALSAPGSAGRVNAMACRATQTGRCCTKHWTLLQWCAPNKQQPWRTPCIAQTGDHNTAGPQGSHSPTASAAVQFNGGKMQHIFKLVDNLHIDQFESEEARAALLSGTIYIKVDGSNHMLVKPTDGGPVMLYTRYDAKAGAVPDDSMPLPSGRNGDKYMSKQQQHSYVYRPICSVPLGKLQKAYDHMLKACAEYVADKPSGHYSVEVVGRKFQKTPGVDADAAIAVHSDQALDGAVSRRLMDYASVKSYLLEEVTIEGLVIEHDGLYWKIRSNCFEKTCVFEKLRRGKCDMPANYIAPILMPGSAYPPRS